MRFSVVNFLVRILYFLWFINFNCAVESQSVVMDYHYLIFSFGIKLVGPALPLNRPGFCRRSYCRRGSVISGSRREGLRRRGFCPYPITNRQCDSSPTISFLWPIRKIIIIIFIICHYCNRHHHQRRRRRHHHRYLSLYVHFISPNCGSRKTQTHTYTYTHIQLSKYT